MKGNTLIHRDNIMIQLEVDNKNEVIELLTHNLYLNGKIKDTRRFLEAVWEREKLGFTGVGREIAIPHGISDTVQETAIAIGILKEEIIWTGSFGGNTESERVKCVILFAVPEGDSDKEDREHIHALKLVMGKLADLDNIKQLLDANSNEAVIEIFKD